MNDSDSQPLTTILLVEERDDCRITAKLFLNNFGYTVQSARNVEEALSLFDPNVHDVIITDYRMTGMTGAEMAHVIKLRSHSTPVILYSTSAPDNAVCLDAVVIRPAHLIKLKDAVEQVMMARAQVKALLPDESVISDVGPPMDNAPSRAV